MTIRVFIIEPNETVLHALATRLQFVPDIELVGTGTLPMTVPVQQVDLLLFGLAGYDHDLDWLSRWITYFVENETAVILLTPYVDDHEKQHLLNAGARLYLLKTINTPDLITQILSLDTL